MGDVGVDDMPPIIISVDSDSEDELWEEFENYSKK